MQSVEVTGRFVAAKDRSPVEGRIRFKPSQVWLEDEDGNTYPTMAPEVDLIDGQFKVQLTRTDQHDYPWHYRVTCPVGTWTIKVEGDGPFHLKDLLAKKVDT